MFYKIIALYFLILTSALHAHNLDGIIYIIPKPFVYPPCYETSNLKALEQIGLSAAATDPWVEIHTYEFDLVTPISFPYALPLSAFQTKDGGPNILEFTIAGVKKSFFVSVLPKYNRANLAAFDMLKLLAENFSNQPNFMLSCQEDLIEKGLIVKTKEVNKPGSKLNDQNSILLFSTHTEEFAHTENGFKLSDFFALEQNLTDEEAEEDTKAEI